MYLRRVCVFVAQSPFRLTAYPIPHLINYHSYNYVRWIQDLIDTTGPTYTDTYNPNRRVTGLDMWDAALQLLSLPYIRNICTY